MHRDPPPDSLTTFGHLAGLSRPFVEFFQRPYAGGVLLLGMAVIALVAANGPWASGWEHFWHSQITLGFAAHSLTFGLGHFINDGLMVLFFLLVGLEIKREMVSGELSTPRKALLPIGAALGGMAVPASIYGLCNMGGPGAQGWGIPTATDIAFALGVMRLVAGRIPPALFVFLTALAIADDLGAVLVIAVFYTAKLHTTALIAAGVLTGLLILLNRLRIRLTLPYLLLGLGLWIATLASGVHATVAGVVLALTIPIDSDHESTSLLHHWEHALGPWSTFFILPLFALANAGVALSGNLDTALGDPVFWGVTLGLVLGKPLGITAMCGLMVALRFTTLPPKVTWFQLTGVACLAGIGFTMSLFINLLAFPNDPAHVNIAKLGIMVGSLCAVIVGAVLCALSSPPRGTQH